MQSRFFKAVGVSVGVAALYAADRWSAKKVAEEEKRTGKKAWKPFAMQGAMEQMETIATMEKNGCEDVSKFYGPTGTPFVTCMKWKQPAPTVNGAQAEKSENSSNHSLKSWTVR